jgi:hypothetical protein
MTPDWPSFYFNATHLQLHLDRFGSRTGLARRRLLSALVGKRVGFAAPHPHNGSQT